MHAMVPIIVPIPGKATRARWAAKVRTRLGPGAGAARGAELPRRLGGGVAADGWGAYTFCKSKRCRRAGVAARAQVSEKAGEVDQKHFGGKGAARKAELSAKVPPTAPAEIQL